MNSLPFSISSLDKAFLASRIMDYTSSSREAQHLCIIIHGLWGNPRHLEQVAKTLRERHSEDKLHILVAKRNAGSFTYDGISTGGERVAHEVVEEIERLEREGQKITRLSVVGYSLGGLVARYAIGLLESKGFFEKIKPVNFTTFASPHLGVRTPLRGWHNHVWNVLGARTLSASGRELFTIDKFRDTGRPLLEVLADPDSIFIKGLAKFERRTLYANIVNDRSAVYYTTGISKKDPFVDLEKVKLNYVKGYDNVILDPEHPVEPLPKESGLHKSFLQRSQTTIGRLPFLAAMILFIPLGIVAFFINSGVQSIRSNRRIKLHEKGLAGLSPEMYRVPLLTNMREAVEDVYENLNSAQSHEYLVDGVEEEEEVGDEPPSPILDRAQAFRTQRTNVGGPEKTQSIDVDVPTLALAPYQFKMIHALDSLGWNKYPVHIHQVMHSHAAIIVRIDKASFSEGYVVLKHWLDNEFKL